MAEFDLSDLETYLRGIEARSTLTCQNRTLYSMEISLLHVVPELPNRASRADYCCYHVAVAQEPDQLIN